MIRSRLYKLLDRYHAWIKQRRIARHKRWLRRNRVLIDQPPADRCIVRNFPRAVPK